MRQGREGSTAVGNWAERAPPCHATLRTGSWRLPPAPIGGWLGCLWALPASSPPPPHHTWAEGSLGRVECRLGCFLECSLQEEGYGCGCGGNAAQRLAFTEPPGLEAFPRESGGPAGSDSWLVNSKTCRKVVSSRLDA